MPNPPTAHSQPVPTTPAASSPARRIAVPMAVGVLVLILTVACGALLLQGRSAAPVNTSRNAPLVPVAPVAVSVVPILIHNAGFEAPVVANYLYNPSGAGWTFSTNGPNSGSGVATRFKGGRGFDSFTEKNLPAPDGNQVAFLQTTGSISQVLSGFVPGGRYQLSFAAAQRANALRGQVGETFTVFIGSTAIGSFFPDQSITKYCENSVNFVAPASNNILTFQGTDLNGGDNTVLIDNVRITAP